MEAQIYPYVFNPLITEEELERNESTNGIYVSAARFRTLNHQDSEELVILQITHGHVNSYAHIIGAHEEDDSVIYAPSWMTYALGCDGGGDEVTIERTYPSLGTRIKILPQSTEYTEEEDPIAALTQAFERYSCISPGQDILLNVNGKRITVNIVSTNSGGPICIRGMEIEVEIDSPEPTERPPTPIPPLVPMFSANEIDTMIPACPPISRFPGTGRRLGDK